MDIRPMKPMAEMNGVEISREIHEQIKLCWHSIIQLTSIEYGSPCWGCTKCNVQWNNSGHPPSGPNYSVDLNALAPIELGLSSVGGAESEQRIYVNLLATNGAFTTITAPADMRAKALLEVLRERK